jgi:hypothetical protein
MMDRVDLDAVQTRYDQGQFSSDPAVAFAALDDVPALIAEIRDLRENGPCRHGCSPCLVGTQPSRKLYLGDPPWRSS